STKPDMSAVRRLSYLSGPFDWRDHVGWYVTVVLGCPRKNRMPGQYIPIIIFALLAAAFPGVTLVLMKLIRPDSRPVGDKLKPYECGVPAESDARGRYSVRFYIIAILFVIFDVETIFLFPWAVLFSTHQEGFRLSPVYGLVSM